MSGNARVTRPLTDAEPRLDTRPVRIRALGPLLVGEPPATLSRRDRVVVAALLTRRGAPCSPDDIADALWATQRPATWPKVVQGAVVRVRRALGREAVDRGEDGYRLVLRDGDADTAVFESLVTRGRRLAALGEPARALVAFDEALALWRGRPFPDLDDWPAGQDEVRRLEALRTEVEEERLAVAVSTGRAQESIAVAQELVRQSPYRERRWELLALALYGGGRQAEALEAVARAKRTLRDDLGLEPGTELVVLERAILGHDPKLPQARAARSSQVCPYQGLTAFQPEDHDLFVGRESDVVACLRRLEEHPLLLVVGSSGSGKSSLVRAGIVPALRGSGRQVAVVVPTGTTSAELHDALADAEPGTALIVDQLEELIGADEGERAAFLELVAEWTRLGAVVVTIRSDRLDLLTAAPRLAKLANRGLYLLPDLGEPELRRAVLEPADRVGLLVEPGLVDVLLRDVGARPGALPLLSHALRQTWLNREGDVLTVDGYLATGGIAGAVAQTADSVWCDLDPDDQRALRSLLLRLVSITPDGAPVGSRLTTGPRTDPGLLTVIERLAANRLVTVEDGAVALSHESLAQAWPRLRSWLDDDVRGRRVLEHLKVAASGWAATGRPESELYRGARLAAALEWREVSAPALTADEEDFLDVSVTHDEDERRTEREALRVQRGRNRRLRLSLAAVAGLAVLAVVTGGLAATSRSLASTTARELAAARLGDLAVREPRADTALLAARQAVELASTPQTSADLLRAVDARSDIRSIKDTGIGGWIGAQVQVSPDGARLLALHSDGVLLVDPASGTRVPDGRALVSDNGKSPLYNVGFVDAGRTALVSAGVDREGSDPTCVIRRFSAADGASLGAAEAVPGSRCGGFETMDRLRVSPDGRVLVSTSGAEVRVWRRDGSQWTGPRTAEVPGLGAGLPIPREMSISDDASVAVVLIEISGAPPWWMFTYVPVVVDLVTLSARPLTSPSDTARAAVSRDGRAVAVGTHAGRVSVREISESGPSGREVVVDSVGRAAVRSLAWGAAGRLVVGRGDGTVDLLDTHRGVLESSLTGHGEAIVVAQQVDGPDGPGLVSVDERGTTVVRTLGTGTALGPRRSVPRPHSVALVPRDGPVLVGEEGGRVALLARSDLATQGTLQLEPTGAQLPEDASARRRVTALVAATDGSGIIAGDRSGRLTRWAWPGRDVEWTRADVPVAFSGISHDGRVLVTAEYTPTPDDPSPDGWPTSSRLRLWDSRNGDELASIDTEKLKPRVVAMSPTSALAAIGFFDGDVKVLDLTKRRVTRTLPGPASAASFSADGRKLVVTGFDGDTRVFSTTNWSQDLTFNSYFAGYTHLLPEPAGRLLFVASPKSVSVWDARSFRRLATQLSMSGDDSNDAMFLASAPAEQALVLASQSEVTLIDLRETSWRDTACQIADRQLTKDEWARLLPDQDYHPACASRAAPR
jgi:DNA-binding SARP family transcriptional activator/WD40 repeat protein